MSPQPQYQFNDQRDQLILKSMDHQHLANHSKTFSQNYQTNQIQQQSQPLLIQSQSHGLPAQTYTTNNSNQNVSSNNNQKSNNRNNNHQGHDTNSDAKAVIQINYRDREAFSVERRAANGNYIAFACGPLRRPRYINERIEQELLEFKEEIEERFAKSKVNQDFTFPFQSTGPQLKKDDSKRKIQMDKFLELQKRHQCNNNIQFNSQINIEKLDELNKIQSEIAKSQERFPSKLQEKFGKSKTVKSPESQLKTNIISPNNGNEIKSQITTKMQTEISPDKLNNMNPPEVVTDFMKVQRQTKLSINQRQSDIYKNSNINHQNNLIYNTSNFDEQIQLSLDSDTQRPIATDTQGSAIMINSRNNVKLDSNRQVKHQTYDQRSKNNLNNFTQKEIAPQTSKNIQNANTMIQKTFQNQVKILGQTPNQKRQKSTRYTTNQSQNDQQKQLVINFYPNTLAKRNQAQNSKQRESDLFKSSIIGNNQINVQSSITSQKQPINFGSFLSTTNKDTTQIQFQKQGSQKRKSSRTQPLTQSEYDSTKSYDRNSGVYKSLAINLDEAQTLLNSAITLQQQSRNQSELIKPNNSGSSASQYNNKKFANAQSTLSNKLKGSHQRTKTTTNLTNFMQQNTVSPTIMNSVNNTTTTNQSIIKTFDYRMFSPNANSGNYQAQIISPQSFISNIKNQSIIQSINQSSAKENYQVKGQIQSNAQELKNYMRMQKQSSQNSNQGIYPHINSSPSKYASQNSTVQQYQTFKIAEDVNHQREHSQNQQVSKRLSGVYQNNQSRNSNTLLIVQNANTQQNKNGNYQSFIVNSGVGINNNHQAGATTMVINLKKKNINQPHQRLFSPPQNKVRLNTHQ
ncbi:UNKNOWN [Stylonychia lemnae]|uniref:Uncharacterized protein n=1 Tax=Stylonychia lemnae TaxID=5949 RepID=A0A078AHF4_STYLE|nr:UNKNOWN [Stylonychia lemnae]|eukprot:CDW81276.1 UNKNOWN [Stylonychia lemnae]